MPKAYSYVRFSTPEQARGDSLRRQLSKAHEWCEKRGLGLDDSLRDLGVSAFKGTHSAIGALRSFLDRVESGEVERGSYLIVESLDRLSREAVLDAAARLFDLIRAGITVVTLTDGQEYSEERLRADWTPLIMSITVMARAHEESRIKGERVGAAWARKRDVARSEGVPISSRCPSWLRLVDRSYEVVPQHVEIVRRIFELAIEGYGQRAIVMRLNRDSIPIFRGSKKSTGGWQTSTIRRVLTSRTVLGEYQPHTGSHRAGTWKPEGEPIKNYYPAVVTEDDYWRAQRSLGGRRAGDGSRGVGGRRGKGVSHLLIGLAKCTRCGGAMHFINKGRPPKGGTYFECSTARRKAGCENDQRWRVDQVEQRLLRGLTYLDVNATLTGDRRSDQGDHVAVLRSRLTDAERRRDRLLTLATDSNDDAAAARFAVVASEVKVLRKDLERAESELAKAAADPGLRARMANAIDLAKAMAEADGEERTAIRVRLAEQMRSLIHEVRFDPELGALAILTPQPSIAPEEIPWVVGSRDAVRWRIWLDGDPQGMEIEDEPDNGQRPFQVFGDKLAPRQPTTPASAPTPKVAGDDRRVSPQRALLRPVLRKARTPASS